MPEVVIHNPIIHSDFEEPRRQYLIGDERITDRIMVSRPPGSYFIPRSAVPIPEYPVLGTKYSVPGPSA